MKKRRLLRLQAGEITVAHEARFDSEATLHQAIAAHPEVIPNEDLGIGPLVALANELDTGGGPIDLLAASPDGQLVIIEFKRGTENPDVRKVVAQVLDYGSALWGHSYEDLEELCARCEPMADGSIEDHMTSRLSGPGAPEFNPVAFRREVENTLKRGDFLFLYVGRDLDERTRRIMTYLAEGPRMRFFAIEISYFQSNDGSSVMVPRTAFVPSWVSASIPDPPDSGSDELPGSLSENVRTLVQGILTAAQKQGFLIKNARTGKRVCTTDGDHVLGIYYGSSRGIEFNLGHFRQQQQDEFADGFLKRLSSFFGRPTRAREWPKVKCEVAAKKWPQLEREILRPYLNAWRQLT